MMVLTTSVDSNPKYLLFQAHCWKYLCNSQRLLNSLGRPRLLFYRSLYVIECSLIDHIPEVGHPMVPLIWLLGQPHLRWEWQAIIPSSPVVTIVFYHAMEVACYHSFWAVKSWLCLRLVTLGLLFSTSRYSVKVPRMSNFLHWLVSQRREVA